MGGLPGRLGEALVDARTSDGRRLIDNPDWPRVMSDLIRGNGSPRSNAQERLAKLMGIHKRDPNRFYREGLDKEALEREQLEQSQLPYRWVQTIQDVDVTAPVPAHFKGKDLEVKITKTSLKAGIKGQDPLIEVRLPNSPALRD